MTDLASLTDLVRRAWAAPGPGVLLIDGPSGSGKSTLADELQASLSDTGAILIRMDEIYPGWVGLDESRTILARDVLSPWRRGEPSGHALWDWAADRQSGWREIPAGHPLLVEGCGAASGWTSDPATVLVWVEASDDTRKRRALARDAGTFDAHWEMWDAQWRHYLARADYRARADAVIRTD
ncbi:AAA family ATPase [Okibacterium fritillariae]|uniref:AAA family ATPase n=1 Tax=Okibacterium fritillariae TaxID=123320 RepID=UPI00405540F5